MQRIIYKNTDKSIAVLVPAQEVLDIVGLKAIAEKDVPNGLPYWLISTDIIPSDRSERSQWGVDESKEPDGFGGVSNEFTDEQLLAIYNGDTI